MKKYINENQHNSINDKKTKISQAYFNRLSLFVYDWFVYKFISHYLWGCSVKALTERYKALLGKKHLEVGVGTGYLIDKLKLDDFYVDLMDLNDSCLDKSRRRLQRYQPLTYKQNILTPCQGVNKTYQSICLNYVMHCIPGQFHSKSAAFNNLKKVLNKDGVIFGASVVGKNNKPNFAAKIFIRILNAVGVFNNLEDCSHELEQGLKENFKYVHIENTSTTALFFACDDETVFNQKLGALYG